MLKFIKSGNRKYLTNEKLYYEKLLSGSIFAVGGLSTVIIEFLIFEKEYIFLTYPEKSNLTDPYNLYKNQVHFNELKSKIFLKIVKKLKIYL